MFVLRRRRRGAANPYLAFSTQPGGANSGAVLSPQPVVTAKNGDDTTNTSFTGNVTLSVNTVSGSHSLGGTVTVAAVDGVATFTNVTDTGSGDGTLTATATGYTSATSASFTTSTGTVNRTDTFDRANNASLGTPSDGGSAWANRFGTFGVSTNEAKAGSTQGAGQPWSADVTVAVATLTCSATGTATITLNNKTGRQGIIFRYSDASNMMVAYVAGNYLYVDKVVAGVKSSILNAQLSQNWPLNSGVQLQLVLTSAGYTIYTIQSSVTKQEYGPIPDTFNNTAVEQGLYVENTTATFNDFTWVGT